MTEAQAPALAELHPEACIEASYVGLILRVGRAAVKPYIEDRELLEPREVLDLQVQIQRDGTARRWWDQPSSAYEVAAVLIKYAENNAPEATSLVKEQVEQFFEELPPANRTPAEIARVQKAMERLQRLRPPDRFVDQINKSLSITRHWT